MKVETRSRALNSPEKDTRGDVFCLLNLGRGPSQ